MESQHYWNYFPTAVPAFSQTQKRNSSGFAIDLDNLVWELTFSSDTQIVLLMIQIQTDDISAAVVAISTCFGIVGFFGWWFSDSFKVCTIPNIAVQLWEPLVQNDTDYKKSKIISRISTYLVIL